MIISLMIISMSSSVAGLEAEPPLRNPLLALRHGAGDVQGPLVHL